MKNAGRGRGFIFRGLVEPTFTIRDTKRKVGRDAVLRGVVADELLDFFFGIIPSTILRHTWSLTNSW